MASFFMAEDDPLMGRMYERAFRIGGHELTLVRDGEEVLTTLTNMTQKPSLIILDVMMPKVSGFDVLTKLKQDPAFTSVPVVMLTNLAGKEDAEKALSLGAIAYLIKSDYSPKQVVEKLTALIVGGPSASLAS